MHAVGCYTVHRPVKLGVRRGEHLLRQAEVMQEIAPLPAFVAAENRRQIEEAWKRVCFHQFHDTLGGTCLPSAYEQVHDQLGYAAAIADEALQYGLRHKMRELPDDPLQRIVLGNASESAFNDYVEFEPWLDWQPWHSGWRLLDADNRPIPFQTLHSESLAQPQVHLLFKSSLAPAEVGVVKIERGEPTANYEAAVESKITALAHSIRNDVGAGCDTKSLIFDGAAQFALPHLELIDDPSDTWSHWIDRYPEGPGISATWSAPALIDKGPLLGSLLQNGAIGNSELRAEWRVYAGELFVELRLRVHWAEKLKTLKLVLGFPAPLEKRVDGILGGSTERKNDGAERPLRDWSLLDFGERKLGILGTDVYANDATPQRIRLSLLRSSVMAYHVPYFGVGPRMVYSDQGEHEFKFRFFCGAAVNEELLDAHALMLQRRPIMGDLTRGMPKRFD
jgi:alpha-mannosidase